MVRERRETTVFFHSDECDKKVRLSLILYTYLWISFINIIKNLAILYISCISIDD